MNLSIDVKFDACQIGGLCLICCGVQAIFYHKFFIPNHPLHQSEIFLTEKNNKNKRKQLSGWCFIRILAIFPCEITT